MHPTHHAPRRSFGQPGAGLAWACIVCLFYAFHHVSGSLIESWQTPEYGHSLLIPPISGLIAWHALAHSRPTIKPTWWGCFALFISGFFLLVGELAAFEAVTEYGFILSLIGLSLTFFGRRATRKMFPAFIYLMFAIPLPHLVYSNLSQELQLLSSSIGVLVLDIAGIPVFQEGNIIDLGGFKLQVVEACSGLRYLFPLMSFGFLIAYALKDSFWKRAVVFFSTIPITIIMNSLRIALIGVTVALWGPRMAEDLIHEMEGLVVFAICVVLLMIEVCVLLRMGTKGHFQYEMFGPAQGPLFSHAVKFSNAGKLGKKGMGSLIICAMLAFIFGTGLIKERPEIHPEHPPFATFPETLGEWRAKTQTLEADVLKGLQLSDYWLAEYSQAEGKSSVNFYIAYYNSQHVGSAVHTPSNCIPGGGWQIVSSTKKPVSLKNGIPLTVTRLLIRHGDVAQLVYFWFDERGRNILESSEAKWYLIVDSIMMQRTDGALIRLVTRINTDETEADADARLTDFLEAVTPSIKIFVPGGSKNSMLPDQITPPN